MGMHEPKTKTLSYKSVSSAERAGFEYHPLNGGARTSNKKPFNDEGLYWRRGRDSNPRTFVGYTLSKRAR